MKTAFELYLAHNPHEFSDAQKQIDPARLPNDLLLRMRETYYHADGCPELKDGADEADKSQNGYWARVGRWIRRIEPTFAELSNEEIDAALTVAIGSEWADPEDGYGLGVSVWQSLI